MTSQSLIKLKSLRVDNRIATIMMVRAFIVLTLYFFLFSFVRADSHIARFVFITEPQEIPAGVVSEPFTVQAQDAQGVGVKVGETLCLGLASDSEIGEFSSNKDNWKSVDVLTVNSNWTSRTFYYKDSVAESGAIRADIAVKKNDTTCAAWPREEWEVLWSVKQAFGGAEPAGEFADEPPGEESVVLASGSVGGVASPFRPAFRVYAGEDQVVVVGSLVQMRGSAIDADNEPFEPERFWWNFGDGAAKEGKTVRHIFRQVGTYTVGLHASSGASSVSDYLTVEVVPNKIVVKNVVVGEEGFVRLENPSEHIIDIGGWHISDAVGKTFTFMPYTKVHARSEVAFPNSTTGLLKNGEPLVTIYYPNGVKALENTASTPTPPSPAPPVQPSFSEVSPPKTYQEISEKAVTAVSNSEALEERSTQDEVRDTSPTENLAQVSSAVEPSSSSFFFWIALGLSMLAAVGFILIKRFRV